MSRCSSKPATLAAAATRRKHLQYLAAGALASTLPLAAHAQIARVLPTDTLRGKLAIAVPPDATLNGQAARLAPGIRVRGANNMLILTGALAGMEARVNYKLEVTTGLIKDVWVLTDAEAQKLWPTTPQEAATWTYDPLTFTWSKP